MPCDKNALFDFLNVLNEDLNKKIILVAAGGTSGFGSGLMIDTKTKPGQ